jgi:hypothetical protein
MIYLLGVVATGLVVISGYWYPLHQDEVVFLEVAKGIHQGQLPYLDFQDNKPPGIYYLYALYLKLIGNELIAIRSLAVVANLISAMWLWRLNKNPWLILSFLIIAPAYQGQFALTEVLMVPWLLSATVYMVRRNMLAAGIMLGVAFMFKQTAVLNLIVMLFVGTNPLAVIAGFSLVPLLSYGFLSLAVPVNLWSYWIFESLIAAYPANTFSNTLIELPKLLLPLGIFIPLIIYSFKKPHTTHAQKYSLGIIMISLPILLFRPYHHYWLQFLPYMLILSFSSKLYLRFRTLLLAQLIGTSAILVGYPIITYWFNR